VRERRDGTLVDGGGHAPRVGYAVSYTDIAGRPVARDAKLGLALYRVDGPLVVLTRVTGLYPNDTWSGRTVTYRRLRCDGGRLSVRLGTDEHLFEAAQVITARVGGRVARRISILPGEQPTLEVPLRPDAGHTCRVTFTMSQVRVPALVQHDSTDTRRLGAHFFAIDFSR
jgi:hypothetical protein